MKNLELLKEVIKSLESLEEIDYEVYDKYGGYERDSSYMGYFDKEDRDEMVKKLKESLNAMDKELQEAFDAGREQIFFPSGQYRDPEWVYEDFEEWYNKNKIERENK